MEKLRFPIGRFNRPDRISKQDLKTYISQIEQLPGQLIQVTQGLSEEQLSTVYRPGGWQLRQVVHHLADSHMNSFIRFKLSLTESQPIIKPYLEARWAELPDACTAPIEHSLSLLTSLHRRWCVLLNSMSESDFSKTFMHPESKNIYRLNVATALYAWHGQHHLAQIRNTIEQSD